MGVPSSIARAWIGPFATAAGLNSIWIPIAFMISKWGDAGDRSFGSFEGFRFVTPLLLVFALLGMLAQYGPTMGKAGRLGLSLAVLGKALGAIGNFGGYWLSFPRSGNYVAFPGILLAFVGLLVFGAVAIKTRQPPNWSRCLPLLIAVWPIPFLGLRGLDTFLSVPMLSETALEGLYSISVGLMWFVLGYSVWTVDARGNAI